MRRYKIENNALAAEIQQLHKNLKWSDYNHTAICQTVIVLYQSLSTKSMFASLLLRRRGILAGLAIEVMLTTAFILLAVRVGSSSTVDFMIL